MDFHCDGKINYRKFLAATILTIHFSKEEKLWSVFKYFDTNDTGYITVDSVILALKESGVVVNEDGLRKTFKELKKNEKAINFKEFKAIAFKSFEEEEAEEIKISKNSNKYNNKDNNIEEIDKNNFKINDSKESVEIEEIKEE